jgi:hypothetical protein
MTGAGIGVCGALAAWAVPHYFLPVWLYGVIALAFGAYLGVAWIPMTDAPGAHSVRHGHFLGGSILATLAIAAMAGVAIGGHGVGPVAHLVSLAAGVTAAGWPALFLPQFRRWFLIGECTIAAVFCAAIVCLFIGL